MDERFCDLGHVTLCYETFGDPAQPTVLLIMGLGTQMVAWHEDFCGRLADRGFHVIRFDNRDVGRSTSFDHAKPPTRGEIIRRRPRVPAYTLSDMAGDAAGLLDHLDVDAAHVVGASMGGMIAQTLAAEHPDRVLSLVSIMSNTGSLWNGQPALRLYPFLLRQPPREKEAYLDAMVLLFGAIGSSGFERDEAELRRLAELSFERGINHHGTERQLAAILATGDRTRALRRIKAPTLVIHGKADRLVRPSGGKATAKAIERRPPRPGGGHGPRPAAAGVGQDHRRDRRERGAGAGASGRERRRLGGGSPALGPGAAAPVAPDCPAAAARRLGEGLPAAGPARCAISHAGGARRHDVPAWTQRWRGSAPGALRRGPHDRRRGGSRRRHGAGAAAMAARPLLDGPRGSAAGPPVGLRRRRAA